ncbi:Spy/CpxP family protein refolding chaperone [Bacteroidota bacterium]
MKKIIISGLLIAIFSLGLTSAQDQINRHGRHRMHRSGKAKIFHELDLTESQVEQFRELKYQNQAEVIDLEAELEKNNLAIKKMMLDNEVNADQLLSLTSQNSDIKARIQNSRINLWLDIYNILNKEQQEIWAQHFGTMGDRIRGGIREGCAMRAGRMLRREMKREHFFDD